jgi:hypothetical protein
MANEIRDAFNVAFADGPSGNPTRPSKADIRAIGNVIDTQVALVSEDLNSVTTDTLAAVEVITDALGGRVDDLEALATTGIRWSNQYIRVRSTGNVNLASGLVNGATVNGIVLATGDFVFLGSQTAPAQNGLYTVAAAGAASRAAFADSAAELDHIGFVIQLGTVGTGEGWTLSMSAADITLGTTALNFSPAIVAPGYAAEVAAARGGYASLGARLDSSLNSLQVTLTQQMAREGAPIAGTQMDTKTYCVSKPATHAGLIKSFQWIAAATGTAKLKVWSKVGTVYTQTAERTVTVSAIGAQTFTDADLTGLSVAVGDVIAVKGSATGVMQYSSNTADGAGYFAITGDATGASGPTLLSNVRIEVKVDVEYQSQVVTAQSFQDLQADLVDLEGARVASLELAILDLGGSIPAGPATEAYVAALTVPPTAVRKLAIDRLNRWIDLKGLRSKLAGLTLHVTQDGQAALVDLIAPAQVMSAVGTTVWAADEGVRGDGVTGYFNTNANPAGSIFALEDCHMGIWSLSHEATGNDFGSFGGAGSAASFVGMSDAAGKRTGTLNRSYAAGAPISPAARLLSIGHAVVVRDGTGVEKLYEDGVLTNTTAALAGVGVPNGNFYLGSVNNIAGGAPSGFRVRRYAFSHWGAGLTAQNVADLYEGLRKFVNSVPHAIPVVDICDGNSLTRGAGTGTAWPAQLAGISTDSVVNLGVDSQTTQMMAADAVTQVDPFAAIPNSRPVYIAWEIRNDMFVNSVSRATAYANFKSLCQGRKAAGFKVVAITLAASIAGGTWNETERLAINTMMRGETLGVYWDALADVGADASMQDYTNLTYYAGDNVHHTGAAKAIIAAIVKAARATLVWA